MKCKSFIKKYKAIFITFALFVLIGIICFVLDYFNIPYRLGFNFVFLNLDFWSIYLGNGIVIALFITTFILFDKRNLEKDKLSTYAGTIMLKGTYKRVERFLNIYKKNEILDLNENQKTYFKNEPFKSDDKIFDCLENGQISKDRFDAYQSIKMYYEMLIFFALEFERKEEEIESLCYEKLTEKLNIEKDIIDKSIKE